MEFVCILYFAGVHLYFTVIFKIVLDGPSILLFQPGVVVKLQRFCLDYWRLFHLNTQSFVPLRICEEVIVTTNAKYLELSPFQK